MCVCVCVAQPPLWELHRQGSCQTAVVASAAVSRLIGQCTLTLMFTPTNPPTPLYSNSSWVTSAIVVNYWHYTCSLLCLSQDGNTREDTEEGSSQAKILFQASHQTFLWEQPSVRWSDSADVWCDLWGTCSAMGVLLNVSAMCLVPWKRRTGSLCAQKATQKLNADLFSKQKQSCKETCVAMCYHHF